jgi:undecaprenyl-diphosphatase
MPFEFAFLDWLYQFRNPVMNTISIFFDYAGATAIPKTTHHEIAV